MTSNPEVDLGRGLVWPDYFRFADDTDTGPQLTPMEFPGRRLSAVEVD